MNSSREDLILRASNRLFVQNGYEGTTMRQIAEAAGVSLGLTTYHYKTKRQIAVQVMERYLRFLKACVAEHVSLDQEPLVLSAAMIRLCIEYFMSSPCKVFYLECLAQDIYMESMQNMGNETMRSVARVHGVSETPPDILQLFDNYIPQSAEKILLLEKEKGNFQGISYEQIPEIVFSISVDRFLDHKEIHAATAKGHKIAQKAFAKLPENLPETLFL